MNIFREIDTRPHAMDALAGLVRCDLALGRLEPALKNVNELWTNLQTHGPEGMEYPIWAYLTCGDLYDAFAEREKSHRAIESGYNELYRRADRIGGNDWCDSYLQKFTFYREIVPTWERISP